MVFELHSEEKQYYRSFENMNQNCDFEKFVTTPKSLHESFLSSFLLTWNNSPIVHYDTKKLLDREKLFLLFKLIVYTRPLRGLVIKWPAHRTELQTRAKAEGAIRSADISRQAEGSDTTQATTVGTAATDERSRSAIFICV